MVDLLVFLKILTVPFGFATPIIFRRLFGGPFKFSQHRFFDEAVGFTLAWMITYPAGLLITLAVVFLIPSSEIILYSYLLILDIVLGSLGGWVWVVLMRPANTGQ